MKQEIGIIGVIGAGKMGEALIAGLIGSGFDAGKIMAYDPDADRVDKMRNEYGIKVQKSNPDLVKSSDVVILAVKPQQMDRVLDEISSSVRVKNPVLISIAAGVKTETIKAHLGDNLRLARVMPNTPALIREGVSAYFACSGMSIDDKAKVEMVLAALGRVFEVEKEDLLDAVTGLSGSGPAYVFMMIEALADAGVKMGLTRKLAQDLAVQTFIGSARMVQLSGKHPAELKDMVASPGGTTIAGLSVLEQGGMRGLLIKAVESATIRSRELGGGSIKKDKKVERRIRRKR
jgi:pyrroline-5-carboxylate reductase